MIAVVVVTYNAKPYLADLLQSLFATQYVGTWRLIVVDNASTDDTVRIISHSQFLTAKAGSRCGGTIPNSQLISNSSNLGFAEGNNIGIRAALEEGADFVVLLNHDTVVDPHWLTNLEATMKSDEKIGAAQARLMLWPAEGEARQGRPDKDKINSIGNEIHYLGFGYTGGYQQRFEMSKCRNVEISYCSGAAVMYRASALRAVGFLDESFFMYHEDLDLGWRLWMAGWKNVLASEAVVYHKYEFSRSIKKYYFMERNRFLVLLELYRIPTLILIAPAFFVMELGLFVKALVSGWGREKFRAYAFFLRPLTWKLIWTKRKEKQSLRRVSDRAITQRFTGVIESQEFSSPIVRCIVNPLFNLYWQIVRRIIFW
ncbi:glycosyltransferase family 2 protein [Candidatus Uhrbacteria bacterium]|nr:glycosyltransferase family 2 protein [Candidatus Uhrbacteria bacterium]